MNTNSCRVLWEGRDLTYPLVSTFIKSESEVRRLLRDSGGCHVGCNSNLILQFWY